MSKPSITIDVAGVQSTSDADNTQRLLELDILSQEAFESAKQAADWMGHPHPMLDGETPQACAKSSTGGERVLAILVAVRFGGIA